MADVWELLADNESSRGRIVTSLALMVAAALASSIVGRVAARRTSDPYNRYYVRKGTRYVFAAVTIVCLAVLWRAFAGRAGVVLGLATAGLAFAMQEVIGALAGWFNILSGRIFRVGDRIQMGGVRGDVIDITPLRTKVMEIGSPSDQASWVGGRQFTGRIVAISNKATFTEPVFNYSSVLDFIWEELTIPVPYSSDWHQAERILDDVVRRTASSADARAAMAEMRRRFPVGAAEVEPRVFVKATDNWAELSARFVVPVRTARAVKDELTREVLERFDAAAIPIASTTADVTLHTADGPAPGTG